MPPVTSRAPSATAEEMRPSTFCCWVRLICAPWMLLTSHGSPYGIISIAPLRIAMPSSYRERGSRMRLARVQLWPEL